MLVIQPMMRTGTASEGVGKSHKKLLLRSRRFKIVLLTTVVGLFAATQAASQIAGNSALCLNPITCVPPHDNVGTPEPLGNDVEMKEERVPGPVVSADCRTGDRMLAVVADHLAGVRAAIVNETPEQAVGRFLLLPTLPPGLSSSSWTAYGPATADRATYVTRRAAAPQDILGVMRLERLDGSWMVTMFEACSEYLYPVDLP
jgi:hypothetical protein